jgi:hypothetical protein
MAIHSPELNKAKSHRRMKREENIFETGGAVARLFNLAWVAVKARLFLDSRLSLLSNAALKQGFILWNSEVWYG